MDTHQYLHYKSCHPFHTKKGIPYGQALRLRRICSNNDDFELRCQDLQKWLYDRGYDSGKVAIEINRAREKDRLSLLGEKQISENANTINLVVTYHPALNKKVVQALNRLQYLLNLDTEHHRVFRDVPRVSFRHPKSLKDILVRSKLPGPESVDVGSKSCINCRTDCEIGKHIKVTKTFQAKNSTNKFDIRVGPLNCKSSGVIYLLECKTCGIQYVGKSQTPFRTRVNNYKTKFRNFLKRQEAGTLGIGKPVPQASLYEHFTQSDHHGMEDWSFTLIDQTFSAEELNKKELFWQYKLNVFVPQGLNVHEATIVC